MKINPLNDRHYKNEASANQYSNEASDTLPTYFPVEEVVYAISEEESTRILAGAQHVLEVPGGSTPFQYGLPEGARELQDLIEYRNMNFAIGNIFKACYRMGTCSHSDKLRDLNKILWFVTRELKRIENEHS